MRTSPQIAGDGTDATQRGRTPQPATSSVVNIWQINQVFSGLLLSGSADGSVRVWRDYTFPRTQRLATSWQVPPTPLPWVCWALRLLPARTWKGGQPLAGDLSPAPEQASHSKKSP